LLRLARLPNQAISAFAAFNWSLQDAHQVAMSVTHADNVHTVWVKTTNYNLHGDQTSFEENFFMIEHEW